MIDENGSRRDDIFWFGDVKPNSFVFQTMINAAANRYRSPSASRRLKLDRQE